MGEIFNPQRIAEIGQEFVGFADQFLAEKLGRLPSVQETAQFGETALATLLASAYVGLSGAMGKDLGEAWIRKTMAVSASFVRRMGADVLLKFDVHIKDMPNHLNKKSPEAPPTAPEAPICKCKLFSDGSCPLCVEKLASVMKATFKLIREVGDQTKLMAGQCQVCNVTQTDRALVRLVPDVLGMKEDVQEENHEAFHQEALAALHQLGGMAGAREIPLTEKAWKEAIEG